jgi:hypothetical protein
MRLEVCNCSLYPINHSMLIVFLPHFIRHALFTFLFTFGSNSHVVAFGGGTSAFGAKPAGGFGSTGAFGAAAQPAAGTSSFGGGGFGAATGSTGAFGQPAANTNTAGTSAFGGSTFGSTTATNNAWGKPAVGGFGTATQGGKSSIPFILNSPLYIAHYN